MKALSRFVLLLSFISSMQVLAQNHSQKFNGTSSYIDIGDSAINGVRTIELWIKPSVDIGPNLPDFLVTINRNDIPTNNNEVSFAFDKQFTTHAGHLRFKLNSANGTLYEIISDTNRFNKDQWYHVAAVIDSVKGMMMFINGVKQKSTDTTWKSPINNSSNPTSIGRQGNLSKGYFDGLIDEVRFSTIARYQQDFTPACRFEHDIHVKVLYHLDTIKSGKTPDLGDKKYDGTVTNTVLDNVIPCQYDFRKARNRSHQFNGLNSYIDIGDSVANGLRTVEMWVMPEKDISSTLSQFLIPIQRNDIATNDDEFAFVFNKSTATNPGHFRFKLNDSNGNVHEVISDTNWFEKGMWYHVAGVIDSLDGMMLFINGIKQKSVDSSWTDPLTTSANPTSIGRQGNKSDGYFEGKIDEVRLSTIARYGRAFTPKCHFINDVHVQGLYHLDTIVNGPQGSYSPDGSSYAYHGAVTKTTLSDSVDCKLTTSVINNKLLNETIVFYPNPTNGSVRLLIPDQSTVYSVQIINSSGKVILEENNLRSSEQLYINGPRGIYFLRLIDQSAQQYQEKIIKY